MVDNNASTKVASNGGKNVCPTGWHVPSNADFTTLSTYLGGGTVAGRKLKETGTSHWTTPNSGATNESGFTALPGGIWDDNEYFHGIMAVYGNWWNSEKYYLAQLLNGDDILYLNYGFQPKTGASVRCVKD